MKYIVIVFIYIIYYYIYKTNNNKINNKFSLFFFNENFIKIKKNTQRYIYNNPLFNLLIYYCNI